MKESKSRTFIIAGGALLIVVATCYMLLFRGDDNSVPDAGGKGIYYTGPMKSKGGGGGYGTMDGKSMTAEEGKAAADAWLKQHPELSTGNAGQNAEGSSGETNQVN